MKTTKVFKRGLLLLLALALFWGFRATAAIFVITDTNDSVRISNLRGAIIAANRTGGNNTIYLGSTRQHPAVFMSEPFGNGRNIHAGLDAARRKQMTQIVVREMMKTQLQTSIF